MAAPTTKADVQTTFVWNNWNKRKDPAVRAAIKATVADLKTQERFPFFR